MRLPDVPLVREAEHADACAMRRWPVNRWLGDGGPTVVPHDGGPRCGPTMGAHNRGCRHLAQTFAVSNTSAG